MNRLFLKKLKGILMRKLTTTTGKNRILTEKLTVKELLEQRKQKNSNKRKVKD